jgi:hypothetical protein
VAAVTIVLGQVPPLVMNLAGAGFAVPTQLRLGWLYSAASTGSAIVVEGRSGQGAGSVEVATVRVVVLSISVIAAWASFRAGGATARLVRDDPRHRAWAGALVAVGFAAPMWVLASATELRLVAGGVLPDVAVLHAVAWQVALGAGVIGIVGGAVGGLTAGSGVSGLVADVAAGAWTALRWALGLSVIGVMVFAAVRPSALDGYVGQLRSIDRDQAALVVGHQVLLAPNQAIAVLVPAMGGCDAVSTAGRADDLVCLDRLPEGESPLDALVGALGEGPTPTRPMPTIAWGFVLVPIVALTLGSRRAARGAGSAVQGALRGAGAGLLFAVLVAVSIGLATVTIATRNVLSDQLEGAEQAAQLAFGPALGRGTLLALAWGVVVGSLGGLAAARDRGSEPVSRRGGPR